jgi:hypothetical protein
VWRNPAAPGSRRDDDRVRRRADRPPCDWLGLQSSLRNAETGIAVGPGVGSGIVTVADHGTGTIAPTQPRLYSIRSRGTDVGITGSLARNTPTSA